MRALSQFSLNVDTSWYLNAQSVCLCFSERSATMQLHITHTWSIISRPDFKVKVFTRINSNPWFSWRGKLMQTLHILFSLSLHCCMGKKLTNKQSSMRTSVQLSTMICRQRRNLCYLKHVLWCLLIKIVENIDGENIFWGNMNFENVW